MIVEQIEDVIVPHKVIGVNTGWEEEILPILEICANYFGGEMSNPTSEERIRKCEQTLGTSLPNDLKLFYLKFGVVKLMEELFEVEDFHFITKNLGANFINDYNTQEQSVLSELIVFGDYLGNGDVWCFHKESKKIFFFKHDTVPNINQMFETFYEYLQSLLIFSQGIMVEGNENFDKAIEQLVVKLIGKERLKVWQYHSGWE
jgi:SMI1-KNR4 cell-wall